MVLREMTQLGNDDEERRAYELWDQYQDDCDWEAYDHHDHQDECNVSMEVEGFKFEGYGFMDPYGTYKEVKSMDCTLPSGRVINVYPGNHPGIAPEANNETNDNTMANRVSMNEAQLRDKVYKMVCESFEALMAEGKTFKDQKSWNKKGFQKSNKFQKNDKYQNWKNGGNMSSDQDECMNEGVDEIDWKTYANAAKKAQGKWYDAAIADDKPNRSKYAEKWRKFDKASQDAFNDEFGTNKYKYTTDGVDDANHAWDRVVTRPGEHKKVSSLSDGGWNQSYFDYDPEKDQTQASWFEDGDSHKGHSHYSEFPRNKDVRPYEFNDMDAEEILNGVGNQIDKRYPGEGHFDAAKRGNEELKNYFQGKYDYNDEKGWHLKEAALRKVVSEAVKNALKKLQ